MRYSIVIASAALFACGNTYHPEYHPVTVMQNQQDLTYPVTVNNGGPPEQRSPVVIAPAPMMGQPAMVAPKPPTPPPGWQGWPSE